MVSKNHTNATVQVLDNYTGQVYWSGAVWCSRKRARKEVEVWGGGLQDGFFFSSLTYKWNSAVEKKPAL